MPRVINDFGLFAEPRAVAPGHAAAEIDGDC
jgi:hypothetical protein